MYIELIYTIFRIIDFIQYSIYLLDFLLCFIVLL